MSSHQIGRIARLLGVAPDEVRGLDDVPDADLRVLHDQISHRLFGDAQEGFEKIAGLAALIPSPLAALLAERFVAPVIAARVAEVLDPARGRDLVGRLRIGYLADVSVLLDPVRSRGVVRAMPAARVGEVARELYARGEHAVMAEFVGCVRVEAIRASMDVATDDDLLAVVPLLEWNPGLDDVVAGLPAARRAGLRERLELALDGGKITPAVAAPLLAVLEA